MTYNQSASNDSARTHSISLSDRARLDITAVTDVRGFNDEVILLTTDAGDMTVRGEGLHIDALDLSGGTLTVTGRISDIGYSEPPVTRGLWRKLFERVES